MRPVFTRRLTLLGASVALVAMALPASVLAASPGTCSGGTMLAGTYSSFTVTGTCTIDKGANVHINGDLTIAAGASLNDHGAEMWQGAQMHIAGDVYVGKGAVLGLGWNSPQGEGSLGPDTVGGDIVANQPLAMQLGQVTVGGSVISNGGGVQNVSGAGRNFPVEDSVIHGNLIVQGWHGGWIGLIRNTVHRNVIFSNNVSRFNRDTGTGMDPDSSEVMGSAFGPVSIPQTSRIMASISPPPASLIWSRLGLTPTSEFDLSILGQLGEPAQLL